MLFAAVGVEALGSETAVCGRCCYHAICSCWGGGAGERDCGDESADGAVTMLFAAVGVEVLGSDHAICSCWGAGAEERDGGNESADGAVTTLFAAVVGRRCAGERDGGDESADGAATMLFAAVGVEVLGSETAETNLRTVL